VTEDRGDPACAPGDRLIARNRLRSAARSFPLHLETSPMSRLTRSLLVSLAIAATVAVTGPSTATAQNNAKRRPAAADNLETRHWTIDGVDRVALVHVPAMAKASPRPVVFAFHGHGGTANQAAKAFAIHKHWPQAIVVYMEGLPTAAGNDPEGKQSGWQYNAGENDDRDVKFFDAVLGDLHQDLKVDDKRVYAIGFSNGGGFTYVLWSLRGDQISAVVSCAMRASRKLISTFKAKPLLQIAGNEDTLQPVSEEEKTVLAVAKLNECGEGRPWGTRTGCTIYPSETGTPVVFFVHSGGHEVPKEAPSRIVEFLKRETQSGRGSPSDPPGNPAVGDWQLNQPTVGESKLHISEEAGRLEVQEVGNGNARSTIASCKDGLLVVHWEVSEDLRGYWVLNLNEDHTKGTGKTVFIRFKDFEPGEPQEIEGRKVRVVEGVTIERIAPNAP
jgi:polyhydroxybutyrate depolymerase